MLERLDEVYADAGLIVTVAMGPVDPFYEAAVLFFDAAEEAGVTVIVSMLALAEAVQVLRWRAKMRHPRRDGSEEERAGADAAAAAAVGNLLRTVRSLFARNQIEILEDIAAATPDFTHLFEKMLEHPGRTPAARRGNSYQHVAMGPIDLLHIILAYLAKIRAICTTDKAIAQIKDDPLYGGMEVITLLPRPAPAKRRRSRSRRR